MNGKNKFWIVISLIIVFLAGITGGIFIDKYLFEKKPRWTKKERSGRERTQFPSLEIMADELALSPEQQEQIREIFKNNEERFKKLRGQMNEQLMNMRKQLREEIFNVFNQEQKKKFEAMIDKYITQRKEEKEQRESFRKKHPRSREEGERK